MDRSPRAYVVVDLGFGDSGKGLLTDHLVRATGARVVVRYNGGAQAGHNVVTADGRHHTFAQLGAGSFVAGTWTLLSRHVVLHPTALLVEAAALERKGVRAPLERVRISDRARVITPFHQTANRLRELARGAGRHGSCGVGVGEVVEDARRQPGEVLHAGHLRDPAGARRLLLRIQERKRAELRPLLDAVAALPEARGELALLESREVGTAWLERASALVKAGAVADDALLSRWLDASGPVVFEGAQGLLLDEVHGFFPHMTWSNVTADHAQALLAEAGWTAPVERLGVLRAHAMRHGAGPLPTELDRFDAVVSDHNATNPWQGQVRRGAFDAVLARYALAVLRGVDRLLLTHVDGVLRAGRFRFASSYSPAASAPLPEAFRLEEAPAGPLAPVTALRPQPDFEEARSSALTRFLCSAVADLREEPVTNPDAVVTRVAGLLGRPVDAISAGPTAGDVRWLAAGVPSPA